VQIRDKDVQIRDKKGIGVWRMVWLTLEQAPHDAHVA
jgi:hypothetical protein